ncbi:hypothetical protein EIZ47_05330 [Chryseobacterium lacus]|uniref:CCDC81-like prokaryotic HU domain-containing protein n=1 Tax=Chryseobacterium lacus TaxID=2058346 RepID=A0A368MZA1_9FLAO|nr:hypothetical protein [Chryseobacterium lacus]RCU43587.1 hypothetical protein DQ356_05375 [Chryseobacterium lacus]RST28604.1 hypothetical protein EIZ47_05330 [Chryseobacterium lacus]
MNISADILDFVKEKGKAPVPGFGIFSFESTAAQLNSDTKTLLPPAGRIVFESDYTISDNRIIDFIASKNNIPHHEAQTALEKMTAFWKNKTELAEPFEAEGLGEFQMHDDRLLFKGKRAEQIHPDFYGLEQIVLADLKNNQTKSDTSGNYRFRKSFWWWFPILIIMGIIVYFAATQKELLFGAPSFLQPEEVAEAPQIQEEKKIIPAVSDSMKADTMQTENAAPQTPESTWKK